MPRHELFFVQCFNKTSQCEFMLENGPLRPTKCQISGLCTNAASLFWFDKNDYKMKIYQIFLLFGLLLVAQGKPITFSIVSLIFMSQFMGKLMHLLSKNTDFSAFVYFLKSKRVNVNIVYSVPKNSTIWRIWTIFWHLKKL